VSEYNAEAGKPTIVHVASNGSVKSESERVKVLDCEETESSGTDYLQSMLSKLQI